jgi:hypothetical protein
VDFRQGAGDDNQQIRWFQRLFYNQISTNLVQERAAVAEQEQRANNQERQ